MGCWCSGASSLRAARCSCQWSLASSCCGRYSGSFPLASPLCRSVHTSDKLSANLVVAWTSSPHSAAQHPLGRTFASIQAEKKSKPGRTGSRAAASKKKHHGHPSFHAPVQAVLHLKLYAAQGTLLMRMEPGRFANVTSIHKQCCLCLLPHPMCGCQSHSHTCYF